MKFFDCVLLELEFKLVSKHAHNMFGLVVRLSESRRVTLILVESYIVEQNHDESKHILRVPFTFFICFSIVLMFFSSG
jgi:protoporphyrinogen oxidase